MLEVLCQSSSTAFSSVFAMSITTIHFSSATIVSRLSSQGLPVLFEGGCRV